jgi:hypothetical protein
MGMNEDQRERGEGIMLPNRGDGKVSEFRLNPQLKVEKHTWVQTGHRSKRKSTSKMDNGQQDEMFPSPLSLIPPARWTTSPPF